MAQLISNYYKHEIRNALIVSINLHHAFLPGGAQGLFNVLEALCCKKNKIII